MIVNKNIKKALNSLIRIVDFLKIRFLLSKFHKRFKFLNFWDIKKKLKKFGWKKNGLEFDITHLCNKYCNFCEHRVKTSDYKYLTKEDYNYIVSCIKNPEKITSLLIIGGEPLCHPNFERLMRNILEDFPKAKVRISTNGKLLPTINKEIFNKLFFVVSEYPNWNDEIIEKYRNYPNIFINKFNGFWNPFKNPNLDDKTAKKVRKFCRHQIRIIGTKLYGCCLSEGVERDYNTEPTYIKFDKNWKKNLSKIPTWRACKHCFRAIDFLKYKTIFPKKNRIYNHQFEVIKI